MNSLWRLQVRTDSKDQYPIGKYCLDNQVAAIGWSLHHPVDGRWTVSKEERESIGNDFGQFIKYANNHNTMVPEGKSKYKIDSVRRMAEEVRVGDLIWMRSFGIYFIGRVSEDSFWSFNASDEATEKDASNQLNNIKWLVVGDESEVPGAINTALIQGRTFQRIQKIGAKEFSGALYDKLADTTHYADLHCENTCESFYNLLSPADAEDLLCLWLYHEYKYVCIPSTNKIATPLYECVLLNIKDGSKVFVQVKKGTKDTIDVSDYINLAIQGEVWLLQTEGKIINHNEQSKSVKIADPKVLYNFSFNESSKTYLSPSINRWVDILKASE